MYQQNDCLYPFEPFLTSIVYRDAQVKEFMSNFIPEMVRRDNDNPEIFGVTLEEMVNVLKKSMQSNIFQIS